MYLCSVFEAQNIVLLFNLNTKMKKLFLSFAVIAGFSMVSCGNKAENATEAEATDSVEVVEAAAVEEVVDTLTNDTTAVVETVEAAAEEPAK